MLPKFLSAKPLVIIAFVAAIFLNGCDTGGSSTTSTQTPEPAAPDAPATQQLPAEVLTTGVSNDFFDVTFISPTTGFVAGDHRLVLRTTDAGQTWQQVLGFPIAAADIEDVPPVRDIGFIDINTGAVVGDDGFINTTVDGGTTWSWPLFMDPPAVDFWTLSWSNNGTDGTVFGSENSVFTTDDGGQSWEEEYQEEEENGEDDFQISSAHTIFIDNMLAIRTDSYGQNQIVQSFDGGSTWEPILLTGDLALLEFNDIKIHWNGDAYVVGSDGTLLILRTSDNGDSWDVYYSRQISAEETLTEISGLSHDAETGYTTITIRTREGVIIEVRYRDIPDYWEIKRYELEPTGRYNRVRLETDTIHSSTTVQQGSQRVIYLVGTNGLILRVVTGG